MSTFVDPYLDPETHILRNLVGATTFDELRHIEADMVASRELEIVYKKQKNHSPQEIQNIHQYLFQDVYDFAGKYRTVDIRKNTEGSEFFLIASKIPTAIDFIFGELATEHYLRGLSRQDFVKRLSYFYDQLNFIHPFREGNGRTQRVFWNHIAYEAGYFVDWDQVIGEENNLASQLAAEKLDYSLLEKMFNRIVEELND